jgi:hypothetical protein
MTFAPSDKEGDPSGALAWRPLRRGIADLYRRAEVGRRATERYPAQDGSAADVDAAVGEKASDTFGGGTKL